MNKYETLLRNALKKLLNPKPTLLDEFIACCSDVTHAIYEVSKQKVIFELERKNITWASYLKHGEMLRYLGSYMVREDYPIQYWKSYNPKIEPTKVFGNKEQLIAHLQGMISDPKSDLVQHLLHFLAMCDK